VTSFVVAVVAVASEEVAAGEEVAAVEKVAAEASEQEAGNTSLSLSLSLGGKGSTSLLLTNAGGGVLEPLMIAHPYQMHLSLEP